MLRALHPSRARQRLKPGRGQGSSLLARFRRDPRGVSALEFALIAPILILMFFGMAELSSAVMAQRRASHADSEMGDLTAQFATVAPSDVSNAFTAVGLVIAPFSANAMQLRLTSLVVDSDDVARVNWSCVSSNATGSMSAMTVGSQVTGLPANLVNTTTVGDSVIIADSAFTFTSPIGYVIKTAIPLNNTFYFKPRQTQYVAFSLSSTTPAPSPKLASTTSPTCNYQK